MADRAAGPFACQIPGHLVMCLALEVKLELSELAPDTVIEEIATILADGYLRMAIAAARNRRTRPWDGIGPDENEALGGSKGGRDSK